jgi:hypothetical protein
MKRALSTLLALSMCLTHPLVCAETLNSTGQAEEAVAPVETQAVSDASITRTFAYVEPSQIVVESNADIVTKLEIGDDIKRKVLANLSQCG